MAEDKQMNHFIGWRMQHKMSHISKSTSDIYIGNVASGTAGLNVGTMSYKIA